MNADTVIHFVVEALDQIVEPYYIVEPDQELMLRTSGLTPKDKGYKELRQFLARHGERVFCYELYHHVRNSMRMVAKADGEMGRNFLVFQAELRKREIEDLVQYFRQNPTPLDGVYYPDFVLHGQGNFEHQELVVEVKADPALPSVDLEADLLKLDQFIGSYLYKKGLFLAVNCRHTLLQRRLYQLAESGWLRERVHHADRIEVLTKKKRGVPTYSCLLSKPTLQKRVWVPVAQSESGRRA